MIEPERRTGCPPSQGFPERCRPDWDSVSTVQAYAQNPKSLIVHIKILMQILCAYVHWSGEVGSPDVSLLTPSCTHPERTDSLSKYLPACHTEPVAGRITLR